VLASHLEQQFRLSSLWDWSHRDPRCLDGPDAVSCPRSSPRWSCFRFAASLWATLAGSSPPWRGGCQ